MCSSFLTFYFFYLTFYFFYLINPSFFLFFFVAHSAAQGFSAVSLAAQYKPTDKWQWDANIGSQGILGVSATHNLDERVGLSTEFEVMPSERGLDSMFQAGWEYRLANSTVKVRNMKNM